MCVYYVSPMKNLVPRAIEIRSYSSLSLFFLPLISFPFLFFQDQKALFNCNDNEGHSGQFVYIRDDREDKEYFGLCEVEVFEHKGERVRHCTVVP